MRISRPHMFMEIAQVVAKRATCCRLNVGALVVIKNRIRSIGYNGQPPGQPHCQGESCPGRLSPGNCPTTHAELNALYHLDGYAKTYAMPKDLYVTDSPCEDCFEACKGWGVERIFFQTPYRINDHLNQPFIDIFQVLPSGFMINWITKDLVDASTV